MNGASTPSTSLNSGAGQAIQYFKGVGPNKAETLGKVGIRTVEDLLFYYPREHQDRRVIPIREMVPGKRAAFLTEVVSSDFGRSGKMLGHARAILKDASGSISAVWFKHLTYRYDVFAGLKRDLEPGKKVLVYGMVEPVDGAVELKVEDQEVVEENALPIHANRIVPVYPLTEGLYDRFVRSLTHRAIELYAGAVVDPVPGSLRQAHKLITLDQAVRQYHFPGGWAERDRARERLAFDEFFLLELALALSRQEREHLLKGHSSTVTRRLLSPFKSNLGYGFTKAQTRTINEIFRDMERPFPMHRLLQGDVGSGKTAVALSAALLSIENGRQVAFLAPTEILAGQHALSIAKFLGGLPVKSALLTRSTSRAERTGALKKLADGSIHLLVGTHAMLNEEVKFKELGLVIIDEQHRFGVRQRERLMNKSVGRAGLVEEALIERLQPDVLILTATPIPRTLAATLYGDLDISVIDELPAGRSPIRTYFASTATAFERVDAALGQGRQAYVVFPLIEESSLLAKKGKSVKAAAHEFDVLKARFPNAAVGLLHGQMDADEKKVVMDRFRAGEIQILAATPVIEVGIDVPNATVIAIMNPERFGLAQLHQLRGRVGRGAHASECVLVTDAPEEQENARLIVFCSLTDGFRLAEEDLKLRGPGEILGEAQHGVPFFRVGDLLNDGLLISQAREAARSLVGGDFSLTLKEHGVLNRALMRRFGSKIQLSRVG